MLHQMCIQGLAQQLAIDDKVERPRGVCMAGQAVSEVSTVPVSDAPSLIGMHGIPGLH